MTAATETCNGQHSPERAPRRALLTRADTDCGETPAKVAATIRPAVRL